MAKENHDPTRTSDDQNQSRTWGTWEELMLVCAVKHHGLHNWDNVAKELQTKTSLPHVLATPANCQQKYHDLILRFTTTQSHVHRQGIENDDDDSSRVAGVNIVPWIEELRNLRVAELKREVQRYDVSILSLQRKVKTLEQEYKSSLEDDESKRRNPDLNQERSEDHKADDEPDNLAHGKVFGCGEESDRENRSVNESNSTPSDGKARETNAISLRVESTHTDSSGKPDPSVSGSDSKPYDPGDSVTQLSSEMQSSASLGRKRKRMEIGGDGFEGRAMNPEPLVGLLELIRAHEYCPLFESRLQSQETDVYKNMVRQHLDLETLQTRLEQGSYSSSARSFYRDLLLLFNNAVVFFPSASVESVTAYELRSLVSDEMKKFDSVVVAETPKSEFAVAPRNPPPQTQSELERSDSLLAKHTASVPIMLSRKRSCVSARPSSSSVGQKLEQQKRNSDQKQASALEPPVEQSLLEAKSKEKPVTGTRSSRRGKKNITRARGANTNTPNKKQNASSPGTKVGAADKPETPKSDSTKTEELSSEKKRTAADFLRRIIKKDSPVEAPRKNGRGAAGNGGGKRNEDSSRKKLEKEKERERVLKKNGGKRRGKEESSASKRTSKASRVAGKHGREGSSTEAKKKPRKRSQRY